MSKNQYRLIGRKVKNETATITSAADGLSGTFDMSEYAGGIVHMPTAWTEADIGFCVSLTAGGTYLPLADEDGNIVEIACAAVTSRAFTMPAALFPASHVKLFSQAGLTTATTQAAPRVIVITLKG